MKRKFKIINKDLKHRLWMAGIDNPEDLIFEEDINLEDDYKMGTFIVDINIDGQDFKTTVAYSDLKEILGEEVKQECPPLPKEVIEEKCKHNNTKTVDMVYSDFTLCNDCGKSYYEGKWS